VEEILKRKIQPNILGRIFRAVAKGVTRS